MVDEGDLLMRKLNVSDGPSHFKGNVVQGKASLFEGVVNCFKEQSPEQMECTVVNLHWPRFMKEFFNLFMWPFSLPLHYSQDGMIGLVNRMPKFETIVKMPVLIAIACYIFRPEHSSIVGADLALLIFFFFCRVFTVALKFAHYPRFFYRKLQTEYVHDNVRTEYQLITGWLDIFDIKQFNLQFHINNAICATGLDLRHSYIMFATANNVQKWIQASGALDDPRLATHPDYPVWIKRMTRGHVHSRLLLTAVFLHSVKRSTISSRKAFEQAQFCTLIINVLFAILPRLWSLYRFGKFCNADWLDIIYVICSLVSNVFCFQSIMGFAMVACSDFERRVKMMEICASMLSSRVTTGELPRHLLG
jgi:hypothetical protein